MESLTSHPNLIRGTLIHTVTLQYLNSCTALASPRTVAKLAVLGCHEPSPELEGTREATAFVRNHSRYSPVPQTTMETMRVKPTSGMGQHTASGARVRGSIARAAPHLCRRAAGGRCTAIRVSAELADTTKPAALRAQKQQPAAMHSPSCRLASPHAPTHTPPPMRHRAGSAAHISSSSRTAAAAQQRPRRLRCGRAGRRAPRGAPPRRRRPGADRPRLPDHRDGAAAAEADDRQDQGLGRVHRRRRRRVWDDRAGGEQRGLVPGHLPRQQGDADEQEDERGVRLSAARPVNLRLGALVGCAAQRCLCCSGTL